MLLITSHFILWLLQTSCSIFIDVACYNHSRVFYACCTISVHITVILVVMLKSAILLPKNSMCPILPLNKNYLSNHLEPKIYLKAPEWQDDCWSGNCYRIANIFLRCINMTIISVLWKMREFFTSQEKRDFMLLSAISIFVVIISVITLLLLRLYFPCRS